MAPKHPTWCTILKIEKFNYKLRVIVSKITLSMLAGFNLIIDECASLSKMDLKAFLSYKSCGRKSSSTNEGFVMVPTMSYNTAIVFCHLFV